MALPANLPDWRRHILTDPQTSGGLLVACAADRAEEVVQTIRAAGYGRAALIGRVEQGPPGILVI